MVLQQRFIKHRYGQRRSFAHADLGLLCPLTESIDTTVYVDE